MGETDCGCWDYQQLRANYGAKCAEADGERQIAGQLRAEVEDLDLALRREMDLADQRASEVERLREVNRQLLEDATAEARVELERLDEVERLRSALHRIHRGDPQPWKIAADALTGPTAADDAERTDDHA